MDLLLQVEVKKTIYGIERLSGKEKVAEVATCKEGDVDCSET